MTGYRWTLGSVQDALNAGGVLSTRTPVGAEDAVIGRIMTDSRALEPGDLFLALRGERLDGHDFIAEAVRAGASALVVAADAAVTAAIPVIQVSDTLVALGALARQRRDALRAPVVAITGSSGKTTTKELLRAALSPRGPIHATTANLNNRIGLPRTLLDAPDEARTVVTEAGTSEPGEIAALARVADPDVAVVTTVGEAHLERLGSLEGVLSEKLDLIRGMRPSGTAFVGEDPAELADQAGQMNRTVRTVGFGAEASSETRGTELGRDGDGCYRFRWRGHWVRIGVPGRHIAQDALLALAVADHLGVPVTESIEAIRDFRGGDLRDELRRIGPLRIIVDCYNANPQSTRAALQALVDTPSNGPRVAVLGSMLEMGERERAGHREVLEFVAGLPLDLLVATGAFAEAAPAVDAPFERVVAIDPEEAYPRLRDKLDDDSPATILLKASRGVALERLLPRFEEDFGEGSAVDPEHDSGGYPDAGDEPVTGRGAG